MTQPLLDKSKDITPRPLAQFPTSHPLSVPNAKVSPNQETQREPRREEAPDMNQAQPLIGSMQPQASSQTTQHKISSIKEVPKNPLGNVPIDFPITINKLSIVYGGIR